MFFARIVYAKARTRALQRTAPGRLRLSRLLLPADPPRSSRATLRRPSAVSELESLGGITRLAMSHPYSEFEQTPLWKAIDTALAELERNRDVELRTTREHFIGYLCQQLSAHGTVTESSLLRE